MEDRPAGLDRLALDLRDLRARAGEPSYAEIVVRIGRLREARGVPPEAARPARTTVYDAFRTGRRRLDTALVLEVVRALGADEAEVARWEVACREAREAAAPAPVPAADPTPAPSPVPPPTTAGAATEQAAPSGAAEPAYSPMRRRWIVAAVLVACVALNLLGRVLVDVLTLPLYLDMTGTAIAAVGLGPWWGALVGVATNLAGSASSGAASIPFALVNVVGALIWGYGVRSLGWGRSIARFFALNVVVALACTLVAAPIIVFAFGGEVSGHGAAAVTETILAASHSLVVAAFSANLLTSLADKLIAGFVALVALDALPRQVTGWSPGHLPSPERLTDRAGPLSARSRGAAPQSRS